MTTPFRGATHGQRNIGGQALPNFEPDVIDDLAEAGYIDVDVIVPRIQRR